MNIKQKSILLLVSVLLLSATAIAAETHLLSTLGSGTILKANQLQSASTSAYISIDQYEVMYSANTFVPRLWLKSGGNYIGQVIFEPDGTKLPADSKQNGQVNLYYHLADFKNIIDLLENNPTVSLLYSGSGSGYENGLYASAMNVGTVSSVSTGESSTPMSTTSKRYTLYNETGDNRM